MNMVKTKEVNMQQADMLFKHWNQLYNGGHTQSFKDKRVRT